LTTEQLVAGAAIPEDPTGPTGTRWPRAGRWLGPATLASFAALAFAALAYAPEDLHQGPPQRIFYVHVPAAAMGFLAFGVVFVASILVLATGKRRYDDLAAASAEVGVVFMTGVMLTGPLWGRPVWGVYWSWDPRLTTSFLLWLIFVSYLAVRGYVTDPGRRARFSAVLGIVGFLDVPLVYFSVRWWRALHPDYVLVTKGGPQLPGEMLAALMVGFAAFALLFAYSLRLRLRVERVRTARALAVATDEDEEMDG
jgi:heme exporter protein C